MLKLMKYELRKLSNTLIILLIALAALEVGFIAGQLLDRQPLSFVCLVLIGMLAFGAYVYIIVSGVVNYSRELKEKSGYLAFMVPVRTIGVVASKLLFTVLAAVAATAVFGVVCWLDARFLVGKMDIDPETLAQINLLLRFGLNAGADLFQILRVAGYAVLAVLIQIALIMCTAYLAITLSATLLQNRKGFLRALISFALFTVLSWGCGWVTEKLMYDRASLTTEFSRMTGIVGGAALMNLGFCALFALACAWLLERSVNL